MPLTVNLKLPSATSVERKGIIIARVCRKEPRPTRKVTQRATHVVTEDSGNYAMYNLTGTSVKSLKVTVSVYNSELEMPRGGHCMEASVSIISEETYNRLWPEQKPTLQESTVTLRTYSGEQLTIKGTTMLMYSTRLIYSL